MLTSPNTHYYTMSSSTPKGAGGVTTPLSGRASSGGAITYLLDAQHHATVLNNTIGATLKCVQCYYVTRDPLSCPSCHVLMCRWCAASCCAKNDNNNNKLCLSCDAVPISKFTAAPLMVAVTLRHLRVRCGTCPSDPPHECEAADLPSHVRTDCDGSHPRSRHWMEKVAEAQHVLSYLKSLKEAKKDKSKKRVGGVLKATSSLATAGSPRTPHHQHQFVSIDNTSVTLLPVIADEDLSHSNNISNPRSSGIATCGVKSSPTIVTPPSQLQQQLLQPPQRRLRRSDSGIIISCSNNNSPRELNHNNENNNSNNSLYLRAPAAANRTMSLSSSGSGAAMAASGSDQQQQQSRKKSPTDSNGAVSRQQSGASNVRQLMAGLGHSVPPREGISEGYKCGAELFEPQLMTRKKSLTRRKSQADLRNISSTQ
eukprot:PhM_4_TR14754/c0_g1_i1/m.70153